MPTILRKFVGAVLIVGFLTPLLVVTPASAAHTYDNGFENAGDTDDWNDSTDVTRVADGTNGVPSAGGNFHAVLEAPAFTWWGGTGPETVWPAHGFKSEIDVYLDMSLADGASSDTIQWNSSVYDPGGVFLEESFFQIRTDPDAAGQWNIRMAIVYSGYDPSFTTTEWFDVTQTDWYTLRHTFYEGDGGFLEIQLEVLNSAGTVLDSVIWDALTDYSVANGDVGGPGYGWFSDQPFGDFPIDNVLMEPLPAPLPEVTAACVNRYNGDIRETSRGVCASTEILVEDELPDRWDVCANRYNGDMRVTRYGCASTEISVEPEFVCANRYNGDLRVPRAQNCASTEILHEWAL